MPAVSKKQQRLFGMVHAVQTGELAPHKVSPKVNEMAKDMKPSIVKDYASTKHDKLASVFAKIATVYMMDIEDQFSQPLKPKIQKYLGKVLPKYNKKIDHTVKSRKWYQPEFIARSKANLNIIDILTKNILQKYPEVQHGYLWKEEIESIKREFAYPFSEKVIKRLIQLFPKTRAIYNRTEVIDKLIAKFPELRASREVRRLREERDRLETKIRMQSSTSRDV